MTAACAVRYKVWAKLAHENHMKINAGKTTVISLSIKTKMLTVYYVIGNSDNLHTGCIKDSDISFVSNFTSLSMLLPILSYHEAARLNAECYFSHSFFGEPYDALQQPN
jgi:hypothetical protein